MCCSCGLAALAMAGQLLTGTAMDASCLLQIAVEVGFTFRGEMFSGLLLKQRLFVLLATLHACGESK